MKDHTKIIEKYQYAQELATKSQLKIEIIPDQYDEPGHKSKCFCISQKITAKMDGELYDSKNLDEIISFLSGYSSGCQFMDLLK